MTYTIQLRRDLAADWTSVNPVPHEGEFCWEMDTGKFKIGDGTTVWNSLPYTSAVPDDLVEALGDLSDVDLTDIAAGMILGTDDGVTWKPMDPPAAGDPNAMLSSPAHLRYTYNATEPTSPQDGDIWTDPDDDPPVFEAVDDAEIRAITAAQLVPGEGILLRPVGDTIVVEVSDGVDLSGANDYKFGAETALDTLPSGWSFMRAAPGANQLTYQESKGRGVLTQIGAYTYDQGIQMPLPSGFVSGLVKFNAIGGTGNEGPGIYLREAATGKHAHLTLRADGSTHVTFVSSGGGTVGTDVAGAAWSPGPMANMYMKIVKNTATSWDFYWGPSPVNMAKAFAAVNVPGSTQGFTPDQIGFGFLCLGGGIKQAALDYFKFT